MVRKIASYVVLSALFIGGMTMLMIGISIFIDGGPFSGWMMVGGALFATAGIVTLAEDFAADVLRR